jgi:PAS domain S-box-containing protein
MKKELNLLLVEDNEGDIRIIKELLKEQHIMTFLITIAGSLTEALSNLAKREFDIILLDLGLPDSYGYETFSKLNKLYPKANAIIILTGLNDTEIGLNAMYEGAQDYIIKGNIDSDKLTKSIIYSFERNRLNNELKEQLAAKKIAEEELVKSREKLKLIATRTGAVMYQIGVTGSGFEYVHQAIESLTGYGVAEINIVGFENLIRQIEKVGGEAVDMSSLRSVWEDKKNKECSLDYLIETKNKELKWLNDKSYPLLNEEGKVEGSIGILVDISELKEAEVEIISQKTKSDQLFSNSPVAIAQVDSNGAILNANRSFEKLYGFKKAEIIGENLDRLVVPQELMESALSFYNGTISGKAMSEVSIRKKKDGSIIYVAIVAVPIQSKGENMGFYAMYTDVTKQKMAEEALIKSRDKAEESDRLKTAFLHNISHEIRTPMNAIVGFSALLSEPDLSSETKQSFIETIVQSSNNLLAIITDIVDISNIDAKLVKISESEVDLNKVVTTVTDIFRLRIKETMKPLNLKTRIPAFDVKILTDTSKFYQVLSNLVNNAIKFTESGEIEIGYTKGIQNVEFYVSDTGIGISEEHLDKIFDRFYQVEYSETRQYEGAGLGLSISKAYVELLGGKIWVTSEIAKGSIFHFTLPLKERVVNHSINLQITGRNKVISRGKRILVAEDIESNFKLIRFYLSSIEAETIRAENGKDAVDYFRSHPDIDLILIDIKMPVMDGYEAIKLIREINKKVPIIMQTAFADDRIKSEEYGCNGFLPKPFNKEQLISLIKEYL